MTHDHRISPPVRGNGVRHRAEAGRRLLSGRAPRALVLALGLGVLPGLPARADKSSVAEQPAHEACGDAVATGAAQAKLASELIQGLAKNAKAGENLIVSPASLAGAFETLSYGANASMIGTLAKTLKFDPKPDCGPVALFEALNEAEEGLVKDTGGTVQIANRLIVAPSLQLNPRINKLLEGLHRELVVDDLSKPEGIARANDWVKSNTKGLIPAILSDPLDKPALTVLNALHFKASWARKFDPQATKPHPFTTTQGKSQTVMMMSLPEGKYSFREDGAFTGLELPFAGNRISLYLVTATGEAITAKSFEKAAALFDGTNFVNHTGTVDMPRLQLSADNDLLRHFKAPDLIKEANKAGAFSGYAPDIRLSSILQRVEVKADEDGAEAAAATAITTTRSMDISVIHFVLDKPFLFALRDKTTGLILAAGYVAKPGVEIAETEGKK